MRIKLVSLFFVLSLNIISCFEDANYISNTGGVALLSSSDPGSSVITYLPYAQKVKILKEKSIKYSINPNSGGIINAYQIQVQDKIGWVFKKPSDNKPEMNLYYKVISENGLFMREKPSQESKPIILIPYLSSDKVVETSSIYNTISNQTAFWMKVKYKNDSGWIFTGFVEIQDENMLSDEKRNEWKHFTGVSITELKEYNKVNDFKEQEKTVYKLNDYEIIMYVPKIKTNADKSLIMFKNVKSGKIFYDDTYTEVYEVKLNYPLNNSIYMNVGVCRNCDAMPVKLVFLLEQSSVRYFYFSETQQKSFCEISMFGLSSGENDYIFNKVNNDKNVMYIFKKHVSCNDNSVKNPLYGFNESIIYNDTYFTNEIFIKIENLKNQFGSTFIVDSGVPKENYLKWNQANVLDKLPPYKYSY